jgi:hypothetical protein
MKKRRIDIARIVVFIALIASPLAGQQRRDVVGTVRSSGDSSGMGGVRVLVPELVLTATSAEDGSYRLSGVPRTRVAITFARIGLAADTVWLDPGADTLDVFLRAVAVQLDPVRAEAPLEARERFDQIVQPSVVNITREALVQLPSFGEADVLRAVQLMPGTISTNDYTVGFNVRGGEPDQNLTQLDGITIFNPTHLGGLFSTFDADAVESIDFFTGAFPAEYGGRLSSVLDVGMRPGRSDRLGVSGQVSLISSKLLLEGPVPGTPATFLIAGRRTYADALIGALSSETMPYYFADVVSKLSMPIGAGVLSATAYWGQDVISWPWIDPEPGQPGVDLEADWGNRLLGLTWRQSFGERELKVDASYTGFTTAFGLEPSIFNAENEVRLLSARATAALSPGATHDIRAGGGVEDYSMTYHVGSETFGAELFTAEYAPRVWSAFVDDQWSAFPWLTLRPGLRLEYVEGPGTLNWAPRVGIKSFLTENFALTGSVGRYHQAIHSLRDQNVSWNIFDFWIGADSAIPVASSDHLVLGFETWFGDAVSLKIEGYRKTFDDIVDFNLREDPRVNGDEIVPVNGEAWGGDLLLQKHSGRLTGWISYGLAKVTRNAHGQEFPAVHDRRHTLNVVLQTRGPLGSDFSVRWGYGSPLPYTPFIGEWHHRFYYATDHSLDDYEREPIASPVLNSGRYPYYNRFDISFRWEKHKWGGILRPYLQLVNATNKKNVFLYTYDFTTTPATRSSLSQLPLLPTIGLEFEF